MPSTIANGSCAALRLRCFAPAWIIVLVLLSPVAQAASTLNFPRLAFENDRYLGIAIVNPSATDAAVTFTAYGTGGEVLATSQDTVKANQQIAKLTSQLFGTSFASSTVGWMQATSSVDGLTGFFLYLDGSVTFLDGADLPAASQKLSFHQVRISGGYSTEINIVNPSSETANVQAELVSAGVPRVPMLFTIPSRGVQRIDVASYFGVTEVSAAAYVLVQAQVDIAGIEFVTEPLGELLGLNGRRATELLDRLTFPQLAVLGGYKTDLGVVNYSASPVILTISAFKPTGTLYGTADLKNNPVTRTLNAGESLREDLETMFGFAGSTTLTGWVEVKSTAAAINGYLTYGLPSSGATAAVATAAQGRTRALFSHIATVGYFTGVAVLNPGTLATDVRVVAMKPTGEILGKYDTVLGPGERIAKLVGTDEMIPEAANQNGGLLWVKTTLPVYLASIFGSDLVLANVPPQDAPTTYNPDSALTTLTMSPPLAVLPPGQTQTFQVAGSTGSLQWKVNGATGGAGTTGTVSSTGLFTAPAAVPDPQVVTVTAESSNETSGASVDIVDKNTVVGSLRVVQSVAYLESLSKLYAAEFAALSAAPVYQAGSAAAPASGNSQILEVGVAGTKTTVATYNGENIGKLLAFRAVDNKDYLLMTGQIGGKIIRLDPATKASVDVVTGLKEPSALVFSSTGGDLLVAEKDKITTVARSVLEAGLQAAAPSGPRGTTRVRAVAPPISISGVGGVTFNRCNRKVYFTLPDDGSIVEYDRTTNGFRTVLTGLRNPGAVLGLYRSNASCPEAFHLLVSEKGLDRTLVLTSTQGRFSEWVKARGVSDFLFLPSGNPFTSKQGLALGENIGSDGSISVVRISNLYDSRPPNPRDDDEEEEEAKADVAVTASAQPDPVPLLGTVTYTITISNKGPATADAMNLFHRLPSALTFVSATSTVGSCQLVEGILACSIRGLASGKQAVVTLRATVNTKPLSGLITSIFTVTNVEIDPDTSNNKTELRVTVGGSTARASKLEVTGISDPATSGVASSVTVRARDSAGAIATTYTGTIRFTSTDATSTLPANYAFTSADAGVHTFTGGVTLRTAGNQTVTATDAADPTVTGSQTVAVVSSGGGNSLRLTTASSWTAGAGGSLTVSARDATGNVVTSYRGTIRFTSSDPIALLPANYTFTGADAGVHVFPAVVLRTSRSQTITATDTSNASYTGSLTVTVAPGEASSFKITDVPSPFVAGSTSNITVTAVDTWDNMATSYTGTAKFSSSDPLAVLPADYKFGAADQGVHTFTNGVRLRTVGTQTVRVSDSVTAFLAGSKSIVVTASATEQARAPAR